MTPFSQQRRSLNWEMFEEGVVILVVNWLPQVYLCIPWKVDFIDWNDNFRGVIKIRWGQSFNSFVFVFKIIWEVSGECTVNFIGLIIIYVSSYACFSHLHKSDTIYTIQWKSVRKNLKFYLWIDNRPNIF